MSADLLRRAAAKLREHADPATPGPWVAFTQTGDGQNFVGTVGSDVAKHVTIEVETHDGWYVTDLKRQQADADFVALMHPPVALALAGLLEHIGDDVSDAGDVIDPQGQVFNEYGSIRFDWTAAVQLARAILREPEETP